MNSQAGWHSVPRRQTVEWSCVVMKIRKAEEKDIPRIMELLGQVLQIHAEIRPDVFIPGTTKWCCTIKVDIENSKGQYIEKDKQEATKDGSESTKIQHGI